MVLLRESLWQPLFVDDSEKAGSKTTCDDGRIDSNWTSAADWRLEEKVIAARRVRWKIRIFPEANRKDFDELSNI